ncbi:dTDP-glucose 4,6-dehydratase [Alishewanella sp. HH-ZS]|uniref:dTDP-glucose 4,6-dehydratase n=1 Tax=Alishewanella sp. HH-ZS TaxID=1856684 RepID=UPI0008236277|nr:dTDP-glucose 4,6-dehydratase [Alishewanella sp. HH-ZS]OCW92580.1 dTDP-glucose 4,6-dehydratase [Alishewanella sp. HH-ZS]
MSEVLFVTGGSGFIGSALIRHLLNSTDYQIVNIDKLTYAAAPEALAVASKHSRYRFYQLDINDLDAITKFFATYRPVGVFHLAAESHVDRSIQSASPFIQSNIVGTFNLLESCRNYFAGLTASCKKAFKFVHVSTDEVYGDLPISAPAAAEGAPYHPSSPYSASKAASDHLVQAWARTYGLPAIITHCTNNYGPHQYPEKLIPLLVQRALKLEPLPIYGDGLQIRDWLYVDDHVHALLQVFQRGKPGEFYNIAGDQPLTNLAVAHAICNLIPTLNLPTALRYRSDQLESLITHVADRPGHDRRYALNNNKIKTEIGWVPQVRFEEGLARTITAVYESLTTIR